MKWKRSDGESAKAVREQVFLSRYKSEPGIVESLFPNLLPAASIAAPLPGLWLKTENTLEKLDCTLTVLVLPVFKCKQVCVR